LLNGLAFLRPYKLTTSEKFQGVEGLAFKIVSDGDLGGFDMEVGHALSVLDAGLNRKFFFVCFGRIRASFPDLDEVEGVRSRPTFRPVVTHEMRDSLVIEADKNSHVGDCSNGGCGIELGE
jgi:hypothetical protein